MDTGRERGFTMLELLVTMLVIAILSAIAVPNMSRIVWRNKLGTSTSSVTTSLYLARMKAINEGEDYGVEFYSDGTFRLIRDPLGTAEYSGTELRLEEGIQVVEITFNSRLPVFTANGQLDKGCLPTDVFQGVIRLTDGSIDTTMVEISMISGRIRETNL